MFTHVHKIFYVQLNGTTQTCFNVYFSPSKYRYYNSKPTKRYVYIHMCEHNEGNFDNLNIDIDSSLLYAGISVHII